MNQELLSVLEYMEEERGIDREALLTTVEAALFTAAQKGPGTDDITRIEIDRKTCDIKAFTTRSVVAGVAQNKSEISVDKAQKIDPEAQAGGTVDVEITTHNFGRIAAQTAKQAILQKIRQAEKDAVFEEYKDRVGDIVSGTVRRFERSDIIVDLGRAEAVMPSRERVPTEEYQMGDRIRAYILNVANDLGGPEVVLSRSHPNFVRRLFELEVSEIADGTVEIKGIAREPGYRSKVAVISNDVKVDPVGACVGMRGIRVKNIVRELSGEKIDIVRWHEDIKQLVANSLSPAKLAKVVVNEEEQKVYVTTDTEQLSLAIGKRGQNARLTAKLTGWKIDIQKPADEMTFEEQVARAVSNLAGIEGIEKSTATALVNAGYLTVDGILEASPGDLADSAGLEPELAEAVMTAARSTMESVDSADPESEPPEPTEPMEPAGPSKPEVSDS